jgi:competence protein ComFA
MKESLSRNIETPCFIVKGIEDNQCQRCGYQIKATDYDDFSRKYCPSCEAYGFIDESSVLFRYERKVEIKKHELSLKFSLSEAQKQASQFLLHQIMTHQKCVLHAVCGAGKTEILYESLLYGLNQGWRLCLAIPRTDIVKELTLRLQKRFPDSIIKELHQYAKDDSFAHILVSTIHQLIHYYQEFDIIFLDEADAFPFRGNPFLNRIIRKALKPQGHLIEMSATIDQPMAKRISKEKIKTFVLPARFHRQHLDQFHIEYVSQLDSFVKKRNSLPSPLKNWLQDLLNSHHQALLFVPTKAWGQWLEKAMADSGFHCESVHSMDLNKNYKIKCFRDRQIPFLISTTLLERGITIKGIHIGILNASHPIFDEFTLIQMAGRVGRHKDQPHGEIVLFTEMRTTAIENAKKYVKRMNKDAIKKGLIDNDLPTL